MIEVEKLCKWFTARHVLDDVSFTVEAGKVCGLIGSNGAGKTTLLRVLATVIPPSSGGAQVACFDVKEEAQEVRRRIGYMSDTFGAYEEMRIDSYLEFFAHVYRLPRESAWRTIDDILRLVELVHLRSKLISGLSLGTRQKVALGRVLLHNPEVLLLDEPVSGLDPRVRVEMRELLRELGRMGKTVLISSHVLADLADLCDLLVILERGKVLFTGTLEELKGRVRGDRSLEVSVDGDPEAASRFLLRQAYVTEVRRSKGDGLVVVLADAAVSPASVSSALFEAGFRLTRFLERELDLEEAFLRVTRGAAP